MTNTRLWMVRHAQVLAPPGTCYGQLDLPADPHATQECAGALARVLPQNVSIRCSTLQRCEQLAQVLRAQRPDLALELDPRLRELNFGKWEGRAWTAIAKSDIDAWANQLATHAPGGGECLTDMLARVHAALSHTQATAAPASDAVWITHAGVARCVQWLLSERAARGELPTSAHWPREAPTLGGWAVVVLPRETMRRT